MFVANRYAANTEITGLQARTRQVAFDRLNFFAGQIETVELVEVMCRMLDRGHRIEVWRNTAHSRR